MYMLNISRKHTLVIVIILLAFFHCTTVYSQSTKSKPRMSLDYFDDAENSRTLVASVFIIKDRQRVPVDQGYVYFYTGDIAEENLIDSVDVDANGEAHYLFPDNYKFPIDEERTVSFTAEFGGNRSFEEKSAQVDVKEVFMELFLSELNSKKTVRVRGYEMGNHNEMIPIEDANVKFYVPRLFNDQLIGRGSFEGGKSQIEFPENIAGDTIGNISIIARIEDHDFYGNVERKVSNFRWGTNKPIDEDKSLMTI